MRHLPLQRILLSPRKSAFFAVLLLFIGSLSSTLSFAAESVSYEYDALGRLEKVTRDDGTNTIEIVYEYDAAGNRTARTVGSGAPPPPPNSPPNANSDSVTAPFLFATVYLNVTANDSDPDGDPLTITAITQPTNGSASIHSSSTIRIYAILSGTSFFNYTISDGNGGTDSATVAFTVPNGGNPFFSRGPALDAIDGSQQDGAAEGAGGVK
ncbi:MAG: Ig-like domain-containing protein [Pseudomonadota bacterium]